MRMRRKKNIVKRIEDCSEYLTVMCESERDSRVVSTEHLIDFCDFFKNNNPVVLEIGCGKGGFACELAEREPNINVLAVEKSDNVIVAGCEKAKEKGLHNIKFICSGAEYLERYIKPHSISRLYLNFSCPYPKSKYANHRLTAKRFLSIYKNILMDNAEIHQKTDNKGLFEFSIEQLSDFGYTIKNVSLDLHNSNFEGNIMTEYEARFTALGQPIYRLEAYMKK